MNPTGVDSSPFGGQWLELPPRRKFTGADLLAQAGRAARLLPDA